MEIAPSYKVTLQKEEKQILPEGLPKRCITLLEGSRPAKDKNSSAPVGSVHPQGHSLWASKSVGSPALHSHQAFPAATCISSPTGGQKAKGMLLLGHPWGSCFLPGLPGAPSKEELCAATGLGNKSGRQHFQQSWNPLGELMCHFLALKVLQSTSLTVPFSFSPHRVWNGAGHHLGPACGMVCSSTLVLPHSRPWSSVVSAWESVFTSVLWSFWVPSKELNEASLQVMAYQSRQLLQHQMTLLTGPIGAGECVCLEPYTW